jgi:putative phosphoribosyl transferase
MQRFGDRVDAGRRLADRLVELEAAGTGRALVLGLPRGGVVVAAEVARRIGGDLDVIVARKLAHPQQPELALGALAEGGEPLWDAALLRRVGHRPEELAEVVAAERQEVARRVATYRGDRALSVRGRTVLLVDDGLATGATARAALRALRAREAGRLVLAVPVAAPDRLAAVATDADDVVALLTPASFAAVGRWYGDFRQVPDDAVREVLSAYAG